MESKDKIEQMKFTAILLLLLLLSGLAAASDETEDLRQISQEIKEQNAGWTAGITSVSGLSSAEKQRLALPNQIPKPDRPPISAPPMRLRSETKFDWRDEGALTPVKHQGSCGSCWAFPPVAQVESRILIDGGTTHDLSEQHLVSKCCSAGDCSGGYPTGALAYIKDQGVPPESCTPYEAKNTDCNPCSGWEDQVWKIKDFIYVESAKDDFKWALKKYGPLAVVVRVPDDIYFYKSGIYTPVRKVGWANHAVLLTGWDNIDGCWIIKNSWGEGWGEQGYARVKYGDLEQYNYAYAITGVIAPDSAPPIAWTKPDLAAASSEYGKTYAAEKAIDNRTNTNWFSKRNARTPQITFDLGDLGRVNRARVMIYRDDVPATLNIETSADNKNWRMVAEQFEISAGSEYVEIPLTTSRCQFVRMTHIKTKRGYGTCTEFDVQMSEEEPCPNWVLQIKYADRTETISLQDVLNIVLQKT